MDKYTFENLIINPETPGLEDLIGKEVYFSDVPIYCIDRANKNYNVGILREVRENYAAPFFVETSSGCMLNYACIIPKKEPNPKYVPFKNVDEFLTAYCKIMTRDLDGVHRYLGRTNGIWLKEKGTDDSDTFCMVHEMWKEGVFVGHAEVTIDGGTASTDYTSWRELYLDYTFLDGSPCGMRVEDDD